MLSIDEIVEILEWIEMLLIGSLKRNLAPHKSISTHASAREATE